MQPISRTARAMRPAFLSRRAFATSSVNQTARPPFAAGPAPPRLPKDEQEIFEKLQAQSTGAFSTPTPTSRTPSDDVVGEALREQAQSRSSEADDMLEQLRERARLAAKGDGEELHPNVRRGAKPEFEGDVNPKTGEVGGPKNEPLRWGVAGDWSYNGRVTDF
nr:succinate dehydrogenase assembly factor 4, mitochondrial [Quercus suber]